MSQIVDDAASLVKLMSFDEKEELLRLLLAIIESEDPYIMIGGVRVRGKPRDEGAEGLK